MAEPGPIEPRSEDRLRRLAAHDVDYLAQILGGRNAAETPELDPHDRGLVRLAVLVATDGPPAAIEWAASVALANGASADEMVDVLIAMAPLIGGIRTVAAAPRLARALGYEIDLETESWVRRDR